VSLLEATSLTRRFGARTAVRHLDLSLDAGRILALVGPNGAGKTTALRMIAGVLPPSAGQVKVAGHDVWAGGVEARRHLAWVPHDAHHYENLTVREHLELTAALWRVPDWQPAAEALAARFDFTERLDELVSEQSTGNRQKVSLIGALLHQPDVLLMDEPMNGLDPFGIRALRHQMQVEAQRGAAVVISSHLLALVDDIATDVLVMVGGEQRWRGTREEAHARWPGTSLEEVFFQAAAP
jgi:ABC-2 type transport system ATP-binding protein